ncbi:MAG: DEAD/DEAH box helicase [Candidatus Heimdallarchaeota archaeon]|nr:DEAD/DEAH box helicase [Candidatus Heimdallarchaeota archaeon]
MTNQLELTYWDRYRELLEDYKLNRDKEEFLRELCDLALRTHPSPPISLLTEIANQFIKLKRIDEAKNTYGRILTIDNSNRDTWKNLSSLYFSIKDNLKAEFCLQKYYALAGGNSSGLQKATKLRLINSGTLKEIPKNQEYGLIDGLEMKKTAPRPIMNLPEFEEFFNVKSIDLPLGLQRVISYAQHQIVDYRIFEEQSGEYGPIVECLENSKLIALLKSRGINKLYKYQYSAFNAIRNSQDVCIVAPTGTGKTEAFLIPSLLKIQGFKDCGVQIVIIYPMKALAKDQKRKLEEVVSTVGLSIKVFDGDTTHYWRQKIFSDPPEILITNPDILHYHLGLGKNSQKFQDLLSNLKIVILDEIHSYSGTFGSNMHFILRRLERIVGQKLQYIGASATVANPQKFVERLLNREVKIIECKKGRRGRTHFLMLAPFAGISTLDSTNSLVNAIKGRGKMLIFQDSHRAAELLYQKLGGKANNIGIHRAGLDQRIRQEVETDFREGKLNILVATPTYELGIDQGDLDIVITPPVSVNRAMQRIGRAGRKGQEALAIVLLNAEDPISHYYYKHPDQYYNDIEDIYLDPGNPVVIKYQLLCASLDRPLESTEFPDHISTIQQLYEKKLLQQSDNSPFYPTLKGQEHARQYSIRGKNHEIHIKVRGGSIIGKRSLPMAMLELYPGAFYYAGGIRYRVASFNFNGFQGTAILTKPHIKWGQTYPLCSVKPEILNIEDRYCVYNIEVADISVKIRQAVHGFILNTPNGSSAHKLREPIYYSAKSKGLIFRIPESEKHQLDTDVQNQIASIHTLVHVLLHASLPFIGGNLNEINGLALMPQSYILLYDQPNGSGVCAMLRYHLKKMLKRAYNLLLCDCLQPSGCPKCTFLPFCSHNNTKLDKLGAKHILKKIMKGEAVSLDESYNLFSHTYH